MILKKIRKYRGLWFERIEYGFDICYGCLYHHIGRVKGKHGVRNERTYDCKSVMHGSSTLDYMCTYLNTAWRASNMYAYIPMGYAKEKAKDTAGIGI